MLLLSLRSLGHETIKNLVLAGIGKLIIMDDGEVTEEDLSGGFLFREEDGAVGKPVCSLRFRCYYNKITIYKNPNSMSSFLSQERKGGSMADDIFLQIAYRSCTTSNIFFKPTCDTHVNPHIITIHLPSRSVRCKYRP